MGNQKGNIFQD